MIYLIGGAPRCGKSILAQQVSANLKADWISTDLLMELLRVKNDEGVKTEWNTALESITSNAEWFSHILSVLSGASVPWLRTI